MATLDTPGQVYRGGLPRARSSSADTPAVWYDVRPLKRWYMAALGFYTGPIKSKGQEVFWVPSSSFHCGPVILGKPQKKCTGTEDFFLLFPFSMFLK